MALARISYVLLLTTTLVLSELYPQGSDQDRYLPREDDVSSHEIRLTTPIVFYGERYESIFVSKQQLNIFMDTKD